MSLVLTRFILIAFEAIYLFETHLCFSTVRTCNSVTYQVRYVTTIHWDRSFVSANEEKGDVCTLFQLEVGSVLIYILVLDA